MVGRRQWRDQLLARVEASIERQEEELARQGLAWKQIEASGEDRHQLVTRRMQVTEQLFIEAWGEIKADLQANTQRLEDMGAEIRANTQAVLSMLDRLGPPPPQPA